MQLPSTEKLEYAKLAVTTGILVLLVPFILYAFLRDPQGALEHAAKRAI